MQIMTIPDKFNLDLLRPGKPCKKHGHALAAGYNLRLASNGDCIFCKFIRLAHYREPLVAKKITLDESKQSIKDLHPFDETKFVLGKLCPKQHAYYQSEFTLRQIASRTCVECMRACVLRHSKTPEARQKRKLYKQSTKYKNYEASYKRSSVELATQKRWRRSIKCLKYQAAYQAYRRALKSSVLNLLFTREDLVDHFGKFGNRCVYCGTTTANLTIDHVTPISKLGINGLCNIVPACKSCNCSKNAKSVEEWFPTQIGFTKRKLSKIYNILRNS